MIVEVLAKATPHARALATPSVVAALLEVISLNDDDARTAYEKSTDTGGPRGRSSTPAS